MFPPEPDSDGMLDLTADEISFYYNTHSGELSLEFPQADSVCRGGILADGAYFDLLAGCIDLSTPITV